MSNKEIVTVFFLRVIGSTLIGVMMANSVLKPTVSIQLFLDFGLVVLVLTVLEVVGFDWLNRGRSRRAGLPAFGNLTTQVGLTLVSGLAFGLFFLLLAGIIALFKVFIHDFNAPFSLFIIDLVFIIFLGIVGGALGFIAALYFGLTQNRPVTWFSDLIAHHRWRLLLVIGGVLVGFYLLVTITSGSQDTGATIAATVAFTAVLVLFAATLSMGSSFGQTIREWFVAFGAVGPKLWDRRKPLAGYTLGYFFIIAWFAGFFAFYDHQLDSHSLSRAVGTGLVVVTDPSPGDLLYFSAMNIAPLAYSDIRPTSPVTEVTAFVEFVAGIAWTVVVFSAVLEIRKPGAPAAAAPAAQHRKGWALVLVIAGIAYLAGRASRH